MAPRLGATEAEAHTTATDLFGSIARRYDNAYREPKLASARHLVMRSLLTPGRVFGDTAAWVSAPNVSTRVLSFHGFGDSARYRMVADTGRAPPLHPSDGRHDIQLRRLGDNDYEWLATSEFGIGATTPAAFASVPVAWIAAGERADTGAIRSDMHAAFARSTAAWGKLFTLESITTSRDATGAWRQRHVMSLHSDRAAATYPALAAWLHKYVAPLRVHLRLHDATHTWFDAVIRNDSMIVTLRSRDGRVLPIEGGDMYLPDTANLETDLSTELLHLRIGFRAMQIEFVSVRQPTARGWSLHFTHEPKWELPPLAERMIRSPLKRPFSGGGMGFRVVATTDSGARQTVMARRIVAPVQESAIFKFLAHMVNGGITSYATGADKDVNAWLASVFGALRDDVRANIGSP
jgi:hypothetical protein